MPRGQALVEFALVLPVLLLLILGSMQVAVALTARDELRHAAREAAIAGAAEPDQPKRCDAALAAMAEIFGRPVQDADCHVPPGQFIEVSAAVDLPLFIPGWDHWRIAVTERAIIR